jgi:hypothetical protein
MMKKLKISYGFNSSKKLSFRRTFSSGINFEKIKDEDKTLTELAERMKTYELQTTG